ncbi:MAG: hypothetical protein D6698_03465 [Gammaproteobacteria bacterium]|nr:MAG: hypothetical protein D6698_03465 [Gammaproteobacteria bacterium]
MIAVWYGKSAQRREINLMSDYADETSTHVLILRLWRETETGDGAKPEWRALIEDVSTRQRYPVKDMVKLQTLLAPYGEAMALNNFVADTLDQDEP